MHKAKFLLLFFFIWHNSKVYAANYYFSSTSGNDERTAEEAQHSGSPWQTLNKLNEFIPQLNPGDSVLFKSGDIFYGSLNLKKSGTSEKPIVFSQYGIGNPPIISGFTLLKNWKKFAPGIFFTNIPQATPQVNLLTLNGKPMALGRFPNQTEKNKGYLVPDEIKGKNQIAHPSLQEGEQWEGAELVIRKNHWIMDREQIISHQSNTLTFLPSSSYEPKEGYGFFIQNHLNTLDQLGEWYHDVNANRLYICLEDQNPDKISIKVSTKDNLLTTLTNTRHIVFHGIHFEGANKDAILIRGGDSMHFISVKIENSGENAVMVENMDRFRFENSTILNAQNSGVYLRSGNYQATISNNHIENTHVFSGMGQSGDNNGYAIFSVSDADTISNNTIKNSGYVGIGFRGSNTLVNNNYINGFCLVKGDGGGIYSYTGGTRKQYLNRKIIGNIIQNGVGAREGTSLQGSDFPAPAEGIYLDDDAANILVAENTISGIANKGIYLHNTNNIEVKDNLVFDASYLIFLSDDHLGQPLEKVVIKDNTLIKKTAHQIVMGIRSADPDFSVIGFSDQNHYIDLLGDGATFQVQNIATKNELYFNHDNWVKKTTWEDNTTQTIQAAPSPLPAIAETHTIKNLDFSSDASGIYCLKNCSLTWENNGYISVSRDNEVSSLKLDLGPVKNNKYYLLTLIATSNEQAIGEIYLRQRGASYQKLSHGKTFILNKSKKEHKILIPEPREDSDASLILNFSQSTNEIKIDKISFDVITPVQETTNLDNFLLLSNPNSQPNQFKLGAQYKDVKGEPHSEKIILGPYESVFLIQE
ncbi:right-handed parallel beta-helix repeat-containing protein [Cyclobacterium plantarum]|uniref:Right-handed parallel beta-helix repeat-containing protein n=1 Tax=Cyclobacterium plantarum TaxID=2716263 RepID=A0ABX0H5F1_9BACT|nr:right-handed parallel beta-helix repeat-containing protein [Cyclobacterium plantarum]NHE55564.1 right-handed parallel beta-helix repeat-containing protein [Cyclobacterium plantarum]